ncbi:MAG: DNA-binding protein Alba [Candidatus Micrarchaeia archaeon]|jgi:DNA-binding protein
MAEQPTTTEENVVYVGKKPAMNYVLAVVTQFNNGAKKVSIKARGKMISRAVDVEEIVRNRFVTNAKVAGVDLKTEEVTNEDGTKAKVSAISINLELQK